MQELNGALAIAKTALVSAMDCLNGEVEVPKISKYLPEDQTREQGAAEANHTRELTHSLTRTRPLMHTRT